MRNKDQHLVPQCYLKAWCDPKTPPNQEPYVWLHKKDGTEAKRKAPLNILCEPDYYTYQDTKGKRDLSLEDYLSNVEGHFARIRETIYTTNALPLGEDLHHFCRFVALMENRTKAQRDNMLPYFREMHKRTVVQEDAQRIQPTLSRQIEPFAKYGHHIMMLESLDSILSFLDRMSKTLLFAEEGASFITSDNPCVLFDEKTYRLPPFWRNPAYGSKSVELTLPLSPRILFLASWADFSGTIPVQADIVEQLNNRTRFNCYEQFVTHDGNVQPYWFDAGTEPQDSWENQQRRSTEN